MFKSFLYSRPDQEHSVACRLLVAYSLVIDVPTSNLGLESCAH